MFSPDEALRVDTLPLLTTELLLAVCPKTIPSGENRFCRVLHVDTVRRQCHVRYVGAPDCQTEGSVSVDAAGCRNRGHDEEKTGSRLFCGSSFRRRA
jgi:hypothetical protein